MRKWTIESQEKELKPEEGLPPLPQDQVAWTHPTASLIIHSHSESSYSSFFSDEWGLRKERGTGSGWVWRGLGSLSLLFHPLFHFFSFRERNRIEAFHPSLQPKGLIVHPQQLIQGVPLFILMKIIERNEIS